LNESPEYLETSKYPEFQNFITFLKPPEISQNLVEINAFLQARTEMLITIPITGRQENDTF
jgi:hypothetical protein